LPSTFLPTLFNPVCVKIAPPRARITSYDFSTA